MSKIINITKSAEEYLAKLVADKDDESIGIRIFISDPGTPKAETCLAYCKSNEADPSDELIQLDTLDAFIDKRSIPFLKDAEVNFDHDNFGGQLTIKAPNARFPNISADSPVEDRINYVIQFGGGCQGCGMVDVTLKDGIEKTLIEQIPELKSVVDITDHSDSENAFYKP